MYGARHAALAVAAVLVVFGQVFVITELQGYVEDQHHIDVLLAGKSRFERIDHADPTARGDRSAPPLVRVLERALLDVFKRIVGPLGPIESLD